MGYYAYVRSLLVEHNLDFQNDWRSANTRFVVNRVHADGAIDPEQYTRTGYLNNHFAVGASILWAPFEVPVHLVMSALHRLGAHVKARRLFPAVHRCDGPSYGNLWVLRPVSFVSIHCRLRRGALGVAGNARHMVRQFTARVHVLQPLLVACSLRLCCCLFLWYWQRTQPGRTMLQWAILGLISGLVLDVYYINIAVLLVALLESLQGYWRGWRAPGPDWHSIRRLFAANLLYCRRHGIRIPAHNDHAEDHLWASTRLRISRSRWLAVGLAAPAERAVLFGSRMPGLDADTHTRRDRPVPASPARSRPGNISHRCLGGVLLSHRG